MLVHCFLSPLNVNKKYTRRSHFCDLLFCYFIFLSDLSRRLCPFIALIGSGLFLRVTSFPSLDRFVPFFRLFKIPEFEMEKDRYQQFSGPKYECLLFDVDDTLYSFSSGISSEITKNITEYMITKLGIGEGNVAELCVQLYKDYGTTMAGLRAIGYDFDYDDYHSFVHGRLPYEMLKPDPVLRNLLQSLPIRKVIFSNANEAHVAKVVSRIGLEDCFEGIICFETLNPTHNSSVPNEDDVSELPKTSVICKPFAEAFEKALKIADINPDKTLFFDDSIRNLKTAKAMGLHTVWVGSSHRSNGVDYALESIHNMREALPELWETIEASDDGYSGKVAIETIVRA